ncbi:MAG: hypothetical protein AB7Q42_06480 [Acidimicrobiia bacterium]
MVDRTDDIDAPSFLDRRGFLRLSGFTVAVTAVLAACGSDEGAGPEGITEAGSAPPLAEAPSGIITDGTLLRTATSLHYNAMDVIDAVLDLGVVSAEISAAAEAYKVLLQDQADALAEATTSIDVQPFEEKNPVVDTRVIKPALALLDVSQTTGADAERLLHAVASLATATHQGIVPSLSRPELRATVMQVGAVHARVATVLARIISPENTVTLEDLATAAPEAAAAATSTTVETGLPSTAPDAAPTTAAAAAGPADLPVYQVPSAFGSLAPVQIVLGDATKVDGPTKRTQLNIETPSLNSLMYDDA